MRPRAATLVALVLVVGAFVALLGVGLTNAVVYYVTPTELVNTPRAGAVRLYGIVEPGSARWRAASSALAFRLTDGVTTLSVTSSSLPTGLFRDGIGVVVSGRLSDAGEFTADEILIKHSEVYAPLKAGETPPPGLLETLRQGSP